MHINVFKFQEKLQKYSREYYKKRKISLRTVASIPQKPNFVVLGARRLKFSMDGYLC